MSSQFQFGPYCLDEAERRLSREDEVLHIEPKAFDVLLHLLQNARQLVKKEVLVEQVWPNSIVTDNSLTRCIHQVRVALGDSAESPIYIETVPGAGYRFIAPVAEGDLTAPVQTARATRRRHYGVAAALLAMLLCAAIGWFGLHWTHDRSSPIQRLAVLPLANLTGDPAQAYFVQGVHEALIAALSRIEAIDVISRTSVMRYGRSDMSVPEIAQELDVDAVVEGSVLRKGEDITVIAQLIAVKPERHLWSSQFDRHVSDVLQLSAQIAESIAAEIAVEGPSLESLLANNSLVVDSEAYDAYLQGRFKFQTKSRADFIKAQEMFNLAIRLDPEFADAYAGLAHTLGSSAIFGMRSPGESLPQVRQLALRALDLNPDLEAGHLLLAGVSFYWDRNWVEANHRLLRVLDLDPSSAHAYRLLAEVLSATGRHDEAMVAIERGRRLDPMSPIAQLKPSLILYLKRNYSQAAQAARAGLEHFPDFWPGHWLLCRSLTAQSADAQAIEACETAARISHRAPPVLGSLGHAYALAGETTKAEQILSELKSLAGRQYVGAACVAILELDLNHDDLAFAALKRAYTEHDLALIHSAHSAEFDALRRNSRFRDLQADVLAAN